MSHRHILPALTLALAAFTGCWGGSPQPAVSTTTPVTVASASPVAFGPAGEAGATLLGDRPLFGVAVPQPDQASLNHIEQTTGCRPTFVEIFVSVVDGMAADALERLPVTPVLSLEPWRPRNGKVQPDVDLGATLGGALDKQYRALARQIANYQRPVVIRLAHEMNGSWYPWGRVDENTPAQYTAMWKRVVSIFKQEGATNSLWIWSPNIPRGTSNIPLRSFYPGDGWVDVVGLTGYGVHEDSPEETYGDALRQIQAFTGKKIMLTETGAQPDSSKTRWITAFGPWLARNPTVGGFIWFQKTPGTGANADWRFDDTPARRAAFRTTLQDGHVRCA